VSNGDTGKIAIDDIVEAATDGVLRALEARNVSAADFTKDNGFFVDVHVRAGVWPDDTKPSPRNPSALP
jgi:hypothetical protein